LQIATSFESAIDFSAVKEYITVLPSDRCPSTVWLYPFLVGCVGKAVEKGQNLLRDDFFDGSIIPGCGVNKDLQLRLQKLIH
jgi:hypothetical protein